MLANLATTLVGPLSDLIDDLHTSDEEKAKMKAQLQSQQFSHKLQENAQRISVMLEEARSDDPWTSRARPTFLYVIYAYLLAAIPFGVLFAFKPAAADSVISGVSAWLSAIPDAMWATFTAGYLGYVGARSLDKSGKIKALAGRMSKGFK